MKIEVKIDATETQAWLMKLDEIQKPEIAKHISYSDLCMAIANINTTQKRIQETIGKCHRFINTISNYSSQGEKAKTKLTEMLENAKN